MNTQKRGVMSSKFRHYTNNSRKATTVSGTKRQCIRYEQWKEGKEKLEDRINEIDNEWENITTSQSDVTYAEQIMAGAEEVVISHAGGELFEILVEDYERQCNDIHSMKTKDTRDRRDRILKREEGFRAHLNTMTDAYLAWSKNNGLDWETTREMKPNDGLDTQGHYPIVILDVFRAYTHDIPLYTQHQSLLPALVCQGLIPCAPQKPTLSFTIRTLETYRFLTLRCPRLSIQSFVKGLCDLHRPHKPHLNKQFSISFDVYLSILNEVDSRVSRLMCRSGDWRRRHACAACTYTLQDEPQLKYRLLFTMDGNDSLKRVPKRKSAPVDNEDDTNSTRQPLGPINELEDSRKITDDYYIQREDVEKYVKKNRNIATGSDVEVDGVEDTDSPCSERWKNMSDRRTGKTMGIFDETGIFVALCRHGSILAVADMVKSGEGSQYPLAIVEKLLDAFGSRLGGGYDIGCRFTKTLTTSVLGPRAQELQYSSLVGSFHGHAHNRLCQLSYLATYVDGLGLSDLEGAERLFSRSNELASSTQHSSTFHRQQKISAFFKNLDETDTYEALSKFLLTNHGRALEILSKKPAFDQAKQNFGIESDTVFEEWLAEERAYLKSQQKEPIEDTYEMEYVQKLESLFNVRQKLASSRQWYIDTPATIQSPGSMGSGPEATAMERERRHALELQHVLLTRVHELESKLQIKETWQVDSNNWKRVTQMIKERDYRENLSKLEFLIVQRMFELGKMNQSQSGYHLRQQMAKALHNRSGAIRNALERYNKSAEALNPPRPHLKWSEVVEYTFLAEFELLSNCREDICERPWARPAIWCLTDQHFKFLRAQEEIERVEIEISRLLAYIRDEENFLHWVEDECRTHSPLLAHQIHLQRIRFELTNKNHITRLQSMVGLHNEKCLSPGLPVEHIGGHRLHDHNGDLISSHPISLTHTSMLTAEDQKDQEEFEVEEAEEELYQCIEHVIMVAEMHDTPTE